MSFAVAQYRSNQVQTASPARVIVQFYDGALKFIRLAATSIGNRDFAAKGVQLSRAHAIVSELRTNLVATLRLGRWDLERLREMAATYGTMATAALIEECVAEARPR